MHGMAWHGWGRRHGPHEAMIMVCVPLVACLPPMSVGLSVCLATAIREGSGYWLVVWCTIRQR